MIVLSNVSKWLGGRMVADNLNLRVPRGQMTCIIGRSGEGKSVLLKQMIGLIKPDAGSIVVNGVEITMLDDQRLAHTLHTCGYVFQFAALLDSLTVFENVGLTLLEQGVAHKDIRDLVVQKLALVSLNSTVLDKYPCELSGGMRKRVGLARTLMTDPEIILYDEPTTGLDPITTRVVHELMKEMQDKLGITSVVVSHDLEIFNYADNIAFLHEGKIRFFGPAKNIWENDNPYIHQFIRGMTHGPIATEVRAQG